MTECKVKFQIRIGKNSHVGQKNFIAHIWNYRRNYNLYVFHWTAFSKHLNFEMFSLKACVFFMCCGFLLDTLAILQTRKDPLSLIW